MFSRWQSLKPEKKILFARNFSIGLVVIIIFSFLSEREWGEGIVNVAFDYLQNREAKLASHTVPATSVNFIDITERSYEAWDRPLLTPRRDIARLVKHAANNGAKVIVLDILLEEKDCCDPAGDRMLLEFLQGYAARPDFPPLIIPVSINRHGSCKPSIVDKVIDNQSPGQQVIYRGLPLVSGSNRDRRTRYWEYYRTYTGAEGTKEILWGVPVLAGVLAGAGQEHLKIVERHLLQGEGERPKVQLGSRKYAIPTLSDEQVPDLYTQRIRFQLIPPTPKGYQSNLLTVRRSADLILEKGVSTPEFAGKIVVIGNGHQDSGDLHETPIGNIPGMYVIGNAIHTVVTHPQPVALGRLGVFLFESLYVFTMALIMGPEIPYFISMPIFVLVIPLLSNELNWQLYYRFGIFFNLTAPLVIMAIYRTGSKLLHSLFKKKNRSQEETTKNETEE
jgi:CHASE2 domain-containing sensor protein